MEQTDRLAAAIAKLGDEGMELAGCGLRGEASYHYLYFKCPRQ